MHPIALAGQRRWREVYDLLDSDDSVCVDAAYGSDTLVLVAIFQYNFESLETLFVRFNASPNRRTELADPPLVMAATFDANITQELLFYGARVNFPDVYGLTALYYAARARNKRVCDLLIQNGASPLNRDNSGRRAIDFFPTKEIIQCTRIAEKKMIRSTLMVLLHSQSSPFRLLDPSIALPSVLQFVFENYLTSRRVIVNLAIAAKKVYPMRTCSAFSGNDLSNKRQIQ